jgi:hypothetical protein
MLEDLPEPLTRATEGQDSWSPFDVMGHLIHGEKTDWIPRARIILTSGKAHPFEPFDRFAQFEESRGKTMDDLLREFSALREQNLQALKELPLDELSLRTEGLHPELGTVTLGELLATWATHDLGHIVQVSRTLARQFSDAVGPWKAYLSVLD